MATGVTAHMLSLARATANQQNSKQSTGPRSERGIAVSSRNAITHGLTATSWVVLEGIESAADYEDLLASVLADLRVVGTVETLIGERIAQLFWRLRRINRFETESLSCWQMEIAPTISDMNEQLECQERRQRTTTALESLFLSNDTVLDKDIVTEILLAFSLYCPSIDASHATSPADEAVGFGVQGATEAKTCTVGAIIEFVRQLEQRSGHENLIASVYASCFGNRRNWDRVDAGIADSVRRRRTEALLVQYERGRIIDRYEARLRNDISRSLADLKQLRDHRRDSTALAGDYYETNPRRSAVSDRHGSPSKYTT